MSNPPSDARGQLSRVATGQREEQRVYEHLCAAGLKPLARNYRVRGAEIDLVFRDGEMLVFVEVRARGSGSLVDGAGSVSASKRGRIVRGARWWLAEHPEDALMPCRFDVVSVTLDDAAPARLEWIRDAFQVQHAW
ncbi:MAG: YraN family protein [Xanthomonadales bacterium]|jgi:putative endonuclease|nr:YraN family protein [Xanthomonadales bacterium]